MPSQAELDAQNNASRARQQARRGIQQPAPQRQQSQRQQPQMQQPYVNPYGGQYGTDSIQDQGYYDNYYDDGYVNPYGEQYGTDSIQDQDYYNNYYDDEGMTDEEWAAYLSGLQESQATSNPVAPGAITMATPGFVNRLTTLPGDGVYDQFDAGIGQLGMGSPMGNLIESLPGANSFYNPLAAGMGKMQASIQKRENDIIFGENAQGMTEEERTAYLAGLEASQATSNIVVPDAPNKKGILDTITGNFAESKLGKFFGGMTTYDVSRGGDVVYGSGTPVFPRLSERTQTPAYGERDIPLPPEPEAETPFLQYLQENTEQSQGGGSNQMEQGSAGSPQNNYYNFLQGGGQMNDEQLRQAKEMAMSMGTTFDPETGYSRTPIDTYGGGGGMTPNGENQWRFGGMQDGIDEPLQRRKFTEKDLNNPRVNNQELLDKLTQFRDIESEGYWNTPMTGMRPIDPETGQPASQRLIDAAARAGVELPMASVPMPREPQVQAPMSVRDTQAMLQERFGSPTVSGNMNPPMNGLETDAQGRMIPTVYDQADRNFYDNESMLRNQRIENRPDFNEVTRDIDKYDNRRTFAEARRLVPTKRDKYGNITNKDQQRAAMTLTEREVQDKQRNEYNEEYRAKNLEILQQRIDNGNKPSASKQDKTEKEVAEKMAFFFEENPNFPQEAMEPMRADMMRFPLPPDVDSHLQLWADNNGYDLEQLYQQSNQENNGEGGAAPVRPRPPEPSNSQPRAGDVIQGHRFNGGDPSKKENWTKV